MKIKKIIPLSLVIVSLILGAFFVYENNEPKEKLIISTMREVFLQSHYSMQNLNDDFSEKMYNLYIKNLDFNKMYFTQNEIDMLATYKTKIDDELTASTLDFFNLSLELHDKQVEKIANLYPTLLAQPFNYTLTDTIELNSEKRDFAKNQFELEQFWSKYIKYQVLTEILTAEKEQKDKMEKSDTVVAKSFDEIEKNAREHIKKLYDTRFKRLKQITREDRFATYVNAFTGTFDPHSSYFAPKAREDFDISMSGKLEGIGATLSEKDGYIKVVEIMPGSPSWKQGDLKAGDLIMKVAQGDKEAVDIFDMRLDDVVHLVRGPKGTKVVLTVKKIDGSIINIPIIRDVIEIEEKYAKSTILTDSLNNKTKRIGYIYLPQFYIDMNNHNGRHCSTDMAKEINKLKKENVDGIIIDLRDNGGGSLNDAISIGGQFISSGPIVQVESRNMGISSNISYSTSSLNDPNPQISYDGALVILVNSFSASASEILAAAMQDYKRAIIVGSTTFGKGTVQRIVDLDRLVSNNFNSHKPLGATKLTIQKFYRINGGTTQFQGVTPDIVLPSIYDKIKIGEKEQDYPLPWSEVKSATYKIDKNYVADKNKIAHKSEIRIQKDSNFVLIKEAANWLGKMNDSKPYPLEINAFRQKDNEEKELAKKYKDVENHAVPFAVHHFNRTQNADSSLDSLEIKRLDDWTKSIKEDVILYETFQIISDAIR